MQTEQFYCLELSTTSKNILVHVHAFTQFLTRFEKRLTVLEQSVQTSAGQHEGLQLMTP